MKFLEIFRAMEQRHRRLMVLAGAIIVSVTSTWMNAQLSPCLKMADCMAAEKISSNRLPETSSHQRHSSIKPSLEQTRKLLSLQILPTSPVLHGFAASQRFLVLAKYSDGLDRDVTGESRFSISDTKLANVNERGRVVAIAEGQVQLTADFGGQRTSTVLRVADSQEKRPLSFARDVGGIFTKRGCNTSHCHGSVVGRGGFKLSADALDPKEDHRWIVQGGIYSVLSIEPKGPKPPRINLAEPEKSLVLLKPTFGVSHEGGLRFSSESSDYLTLLSWIRNRAPYDEEETQKKAKISRIEVFPKEVFLEVDSRQQLLVTAHLAVSNVEDVTEQVRYESSNEGVAEVTEEGQVKALKTGETTVLIHAPGCDPISVRIGVIGTPIQNYPATTPRNLIDEFTFSKLRKMNLIPSELSNDAEFLRRVCLDVTGTLPPPERVREFLDSKDPSKRDRLIETLLSSPEYVEYWTFRFADLFRVAYHSGGNPKYTEMYWEWIRNSISQNKPYNQIAQERIAPQGYDGPSRHFYHIGGELPSPQIMMAEQVRVFLGRRLDCAQCHNHPYETWSQNQFWGLAAFFGRVSRIGQLGMDVVVIDDPAGHGEFGQGAKVIHPRTKEEVQPRFLDGQVLPESLRRDLRLELAQWIASHNYFSEAIVNRMWGYFFGKGIVHPVDDFRLTNPPTHPELLAALAQDFKQHGYDLKHLMRLIMQSKTYQLSGTPNGNNKDDKVNYSHALPRPLDAEVLLDAISQVTGVEENFENWMGGREPAGSRAIGLIWPDTYPSQFLDVFGQPDRLMVPERKVEATLGQALQMLAGPTHNAKLSQPGSRLDKLGRSHASDHQIVEELYLASLARYPADKERVQLEKMLGQRAPHQEAWEDFLWALISSREFVYNH